MNSQPISGQDLPAQDLAKWLLSVKKRLIVLMGLPASGKSTLCEQLEKEGAKRINKDSIRKRLYGDESKQGDWREVSAEYYKELNAAFASGGPVVSDNVNIVNYHRKGTLEAAHEAGYHDIVIVWVDVPLEVCIERNKARARKVPEDAIRRMHGEIKAEGPPKEDEGSLVVLANGKDKDHYLIKQVRMVVPRPVTPNGGSVTGGSLEARHLLGQKLQAQVHLYEACLKAGRDGWASETLSFLSKLAQDGVSLFAAPTGSGTTGGGRPTPPASDPPKRPWVPPTPEQVLSTLMKMIGDRPVVTGEGDLVCISFNGHLLTKEKAELMMKPLLELVKRGHVIFFQESNVDALRLIARAARYGLLASHRNNRGQACGILFHPRLHWLGKSPLYHDYLLKVPGHPEMEPTLRPALQRRVRDLHTGFVLDFINFHGKSNLGGPDETRPVRRWQFEALVAELEKQKAKSPYEKRDLPTKPEGEGGSKLVDETGYDLPLGPLVFGGDFNAPIEKPETTEIEPLLKSGFVRVSTPDKRWSYRYKENGGQFDGFFTRGLEGMMQECFIPAFFPEENKRDTVFYRELSDHMPVFMVLRLPKATPVAVVPVPPATDKLPTTAAPAA